VTQQALAVHLPVFTVPTAVPGWRNEHLSVSRIKVLEQCALAFYLQYVSRPPGSHRGFSEPAEYGTVLHDALERTYRWVIDDEYRGPFPEAFLLDAFRLAWTESGLTGVDLYTEGREYLRAYARWAGAVDHMRVLAVEQEFNLLLGPGVCRLIDAAEKPTWRDVDDHFVVNGYIDRVDRVDYQTVEIIDYKSNRMLFSKEELAADLQVAIYAIVARLLYPWADSVELSFHMLRHGPFRQPTRRTARELEAVVDYVLAIGARSERGPYPPRLNKNCGTCDWREELPGTGWDGCPTYREALAKVPSLVKVSAENMEALAEERERVASIAKAAYARKETLDAVLRGAVGAQEALELGDHVYKVLQYFNSEYRAEDLLPLFTEMGVDLTPALVADNDALEALLKKVEADEAQPRMVRDFIRVRCTARVAKLPQKPRLDSRAVKKKR
jgi:putative RecB family exonuclease